MEHHVAKITHDPQIYEWFTTKGCYTSCHSLISRVLQFDCDGDQLNVVVDPLFVSIAERNIKEYDVIPLFYDANKAPSEILSKQSQYEGLDRAHEFSSGEDTSIGKISNMLTRLWNKDNPDRIVAAWLTMFNNLVIDAAKSGRISHYEQYPKVRKRINKAIGGKRGRLPAWFKYSKNGRKIPARGKKKREYLEPNNSTMNRICKGFDDVGNINLRKANIQPFNWQMLLSGPMEDYKPEIGVLFSDLDKVNASNVIEASTIDYFPDRMAKAGYQMLAEIITEEMIDRYNSLEESYPHVVRYLYTGANAKKPSSKQMFWRVYGEIALKNLKANLESYELCENCGMKVPSWANKEHQCPENMRGFFTCVECGKVSPRMGSKQCRCESCQEIYTHEVKLQQRKERYQRRKQLEEDLKRRKQGVLLSGAGD